MYVYVYLCVPVSIYVYIYPIPSGQMSDGLICYGLISQEIETSAGGDGHNHQVNMQLYVCMCMYILVPIYVYVYVYISYNEWTKERRFRFSRDPSCHRRRLSSSPGEAYHYVSICC